MFCVLTGKNGSGKSHLLEAIELNGPRILHDEHGQRISRHISTVLVDNAECRAIRFIPFGQLNPSITEQCDPNEIAAFIKQTFVRYQQDSSLLVNDYGNDRQVEFIKYAYSQKQGSDLSETDLFDCFEAKFMEQGDLFAGRLALLFKNYHRLRDQNRYNQYLKKEECYQGEVLLNDDFVHRYGTPPWDLINEIFERVKIPYRVNNPTNDNRDATFNLHFEDVSNNGVEIQCNDLSTGEKVLMSLAMAIYNSDTDAQKPDLLLIDEPDAGLHPSMSKDMISAIKEFIVGKSKIPVIITTHSATTIAALDDDDAVYEKRRNLGDDDSGAPVKVSKEDALKILTSDIPFLTVSVESRRAVFVESGYDAKIYSQLYEIYKDAIITEPHFFPFRANKADGSNCDDVRKQVENFTNCGDSQVYGIVDYDDGNRKTTGRLLALGEGCEARYAIENYLLDPLLVGLFLIATQIMRFDELGVTTKTSPFEILGITQTEAQSIINAMLSLLDKGAEPKKHYTLCNGWDMQTAESVFSQQGHELESLYKEKIPKLNAYNNDGQVDKSMKLQIIEKIIKGAKDYLPKAVLKTLVKIQ
jgi:AAA15 family ATPase/GTPase